MAEEKHEHTSLGASPGIQIVGADTTVFGAASFEHGAGAVEFQVQIAGDWVSMGLLDNPKNKSRDARQEMVRELSDRRYAFNFMSPQGTYMYRWECVDYRYGTITTYIAS